MPLILGKDGVNREQKEIYLGIGGVNKKQNDLYLGVDGVNKKIDIKQKVFIYKNGDQCNAITGGWSPTSGTGEYNGVSFNANHISLYVVNSVSKYCRATTNNYLNLSGNYTKLGVKWSCEVDNALATATCSFGNTNINGKGVRPSGSPFALREDMVNLVDGSIVNGFQVNIATAGGLNKHILRVYEIWFE